MTAEQTIVIEEMPADFRSRFRIAIGVFALAILLMLVLGWALNFQNWTSADWWFIGVTGTCLVLLCLSLLWQMWRWWQAVEECRTVFGRQAAFNTPAEAVYRLDRLERRLHIGWAFGALRPFFHRLRAYRRLAEMPAADWSTGRALERLSQTLTTQPALRTVDHFLTGCLLFLGILGTLYGLMNALGDTAMKDLFDSFSQSRLPSKESLSGVMQNFSTPFLTSLFGYCAYLFGRFMFDLADEHFEAAGRDFIDTLNFALLRVFPPTDFVGQVNVAPLTVDLLTETAKLLANNVAVVGELIQQVGGAAKAMIMASERMDGASATIMATVNMLEDATCNTSEVIEVSVGRIARSAPAIEQLVASLAEATDQFDIFSKAVAPNIQGRIDEMTTAMLKHTNELSAHVDTVNERITDSINGFTQSMAKIGQGVQDHVAKYEEFGDQVKALAEQNVTFGKDLQEAIKQITEDNATAVKKVLALLTGMSTEQREHDGAMTLSVQALTRAVESREPQLLTICNALTGDATHGDLPTTIRGLTEALHRYHDHQAYCS